MQDCWAYTPRERPIFADLVPRWADLLTPESMKYLLQSTRAHPDNKAIEGEYQNGINQSVNGSYMLICDSS
jgi:hypothetical protein